MKDNEMYAATSSGEYELVTDPNLVERRYYYVEAPDEFRISSSSMFFKGSYEEALINWSASNANGFIYYPKGNSNETS